MSIPQTIRRPEPNSGLPEALASEGCRQTIQILHGRKEAITESELAERLASVSEAESDATESSTTDERRIRLHHLHLPKLADAGLIDWDREARTVVSTDHPVYDVHRPDDHVSAGDRDSVATLPADGRQRRILGIVESENGSITRETVARELAEAEADGHPAESLIENVAVQLHHDLLPKLDDAGLLEYDPRDASITSPGC